MRRDTFLAVLGAAALVLAAGCGGAGPANNSTATTSATTTGMEPTTTTSTASTTTGTETTTTTAQSANQSRDRDRNRTHTPDGSAAVTFRDQESNGTTVAVANATLPNGGYVVIHAVEDESPGRVLGHSDYLDAGTHGNVSVRLDESLNASASLAAMAHRDTDGDEQYGFPDADGPYVKNGTPVTATANVTVA